MNIFKPLNMKYRSQQSIKFMPQELKKELVDILDQIENGCDIPNDKIGEWLVSNNKFKRDVANAVIYQMAKEGYRTGGFVDRIVSEIDNDPSKLINLICSETLPVLSRLDFRYMPPLYDVLAKHDEYISTNVDFINTVVKYIDDRIDVFLNLETAQELDKLLLKLSIPHCKIQKDEDNRMTHTISSDGDIEIVGSRNDYSTLISLAVDTPIYVVRGYEFSCKNTSKFVLCFIQSFFRRLINSDELMELILQPYVSRMNKSIEEHLIDESCSVYVPTLLRQVFVKCLPFTELYVIPDNKDDDEIIFKEDIAEYLISEYTESFDDYISYERMSDEFDLVHTNQNPLADIFTIDENTDIATKLTEINGTLPEKTDWATYNYNTNKMSLNISYGSLCKLMNYTPFKELSDLVNTYRVFDRKCTLKEMYETYWYTEIDCTFKDYVINISYDSVGYKAKVTFDLSQENDRVELHKYMSNITNNHVDLFFKEELK
ncbi:MAG: hypothetical protein ACRC92_26845 [Peptostreptococcaceae bacterium]